MNEYLKCPKCKGDKLSVFGSSCYPESGVTIECPNCDYEMELKVNYVIPEGVNLRQVAMMAHREMWSGVES